jgi:hypothetical protein
MFHLFRLFHFKLEQAEHGMPGYIYLLLQVAVLYWCGSC